MTVEPYVIRDLSLKLGDDLAGATLRSFALVRGDYDAQYRILTAALCSVAGILLGLACARGAANLAAAREQVLACIGEALERAIAADDGAMEEVGAMARIRGAQRSDG